MHFFITFAQLQRGIALVGSVVSCDFHIEEKHPLSIYDSFQKVIGVNLDCYY